MAKEFDAEKFKVLHSVPAAETGISVELYEYDGQRGVRLSRVGRGGSTYKISNFPPAALYPIIEAMKMMAATPIPL